VLVTADGSRIRSADVDPKVHSVPERSTPAHGTRLLARQAPSPRPRA